MKNNTWPPMNVLMAWNVFLHLDETPDHSVTPELIQKWIEESLENPTTIHKVIFREFDSFRDEYYRHNGYQMVVSD